MRNERILAENNFQNNCTRETKLNNNDLIIGPSGAGKTRGYVIPNILQANESMIIADTKGDLKDKLSFYLTSRGYEVKHINFKDPFDSDGYNPLDFVGYDKRTKNYDQQALLTIGHALIPNISGDRDPFWNNAARMYLLSMIAYVLEAYPPEEHHLHNVIQVFMQSTGQSFQEKMRALHEENPESYAFQTYLLYRNNVKAEVTDASIRTVLSEKFTGLFNRFLFFMYTDDERINFSDLGRKKTAVFLSISDMDRSLDKLVDIFYTQAFQQLTAAADNSLNHRLEVPVRFILDDFATNAYIENFDHIISVIRSREIYASIIVQSLTQLTSLYGKDRALTIANNCDNWLYLGGQDVDTARVFAQKINRPLSHILQMDLDSAYLFTRGSESKKVKQFNLENHPNYEAFVETSERALLCMDDLPF